MARPVGSGSGVELRKSSIRVQFRFNGETVKETLKGWKPTPANEKKARQLIDTVRRLVQAGNFKDTTYREYFPDSKRVPKAMADATVRTVRYFGKLFHDSKGGLAGHTKYNYKLSLDFWYRQNLCDPDGKPSLVALGDMDVLKVGAAELAALIGSIKWKSPRHRNVKMTPLFGLFASATKAMRKHGMENPLEDYEPLKWQRKRPNPFTPAEVELILADMRKHYDPQVANYFEMQFRQGPRPQETIALRWTDISWPKRVATIQRAKGFRGEIKDCKTHQARDLELSDDVVAMLKRQAKITFNRDHGFVFENPVTRKPWVDNRSQQDVYWRPTLDRLKLEYRKPYQCRHTFATSMLMAGANREWVSAQLGHRDSQLLHQVYSVWIKDADMSRERERANKVWAAAKRQDVVREHA